MSLKFSLTSSLSLNNSKLLMLQINSGREFIPLTSICKKFGTMNRISCPHAHQQNGLVERKQRHIVETRLALLAHFTLPPHFWVEAFEIAIYLINLLLSKVLNNKSPYSLVYNKELDYTFLKGFGCECWPNLRSYNENRLMFRSTSCIFLGYNTMHKRYKRLDSNTQWLYISCDIIFNENSFPFSHIKPIIPSPS